MVVKGGKCNKTGTWTRPLYTCSGDAHRQERFLFHLECAGYDNVLVPSGAALLCSDCIKSKRDHLSVVAYRSLHIWETLIAPAELYQQGYRLVQIPRDGLCFFTVLYMLAERCVQWSNILCLFSHFCLFSTPKLPSTVEVITWLLDKPSSLLLSEAHERTAWDPLRAAEAEIRRWPSRSLDAWRSE